MLKKKNKSVGKNIYIYIFNSKLRNLKLYYWKNFSSSIIIPLFQNKYIASSFPLHIAKKKRKWHNVQREIQLFSTTGLSRKSPASPRNSIFFQICSRGSYIKSMKSREEEEEEKEEHRILSRDRFQPRDIRAILL